MFIIYVSMYPIERGECPLLGVGSRRLVCFRQSLLFTCMSAACLERSFCLIEQTVRTCPVAVVENMATGMYQTWG